MTYQMQQEVLKALMQTNKALAEALRGELPFPKEWITLTLENEELIQRARRPL